METVTSVRATAFGLDVRSEIPLLFLGGSSREPTGRPLTISAPVGDARELGWPMSAELVCDERQPDGRVNFRIESHPQAGYLISGPEYGAHLLSTDGTNLRCAPGGSPNGAWQRLLIAQVLPFAALLQGLEIFHASAVVRASEGIAFLGPSHAGKTSLALEFCHRGAAFLADDVLALESGAELLAHAGTPVAGVAHTELTHPREHMCFYEEVVAVNDREQLVRMPGNSGPVRVRALFFLDRRGSEHEGVHFETVADPQMLLTATFNFVLATPERLRRLLDVCALASRGRVERIIVGSDIDAKQLAAAIEHRLSTGA